MNRCPSRNNERRKNKCRPRRLAENILIENLLSLNAVAFLTEEPLRLKSGLVTPIYVDNRKLITHPDAWHDVIETMRGFAD